MEISSAIENENFKFVTRERERNRYHRIMKSPKYRDRINKIHRENQRRRMKNVEYRKKYYEYQRKYRKK